MANHRPVDSDQVDGGRPPVRRAPDPPEVAVFARLGSWCFRRRWVVVIGMGRRRHRRSASPRARRVAPSGRTSPRRASRAPTASTSSNEETGGFGAGIPGTIVFRAEQGVDDPEVEAQMTQLFTTVQAIAADPDVDLDPSTGSATSSVDALEAADLDAWEGMTLASPYEPTPEPQVATEGPEAGKIAFASLEIPGTDWADAAPIAAPLAGALPRDRRRAGRARRRRLRRVRGAASPRRSAWPSPS